MSIRINPLIALILMSMIAPAPSFAADYARLFKKVNPSVVVIKTVQRTLPETFGMKPAVAGGIGSGALVSPNHVLTAVHVVELADAVEVEFLNGHKSLAKIVSAESMADVALLELESPPEGIKPVKLGNSDDVSVGDEIFVIGAPYGVEHTLTIGHISGRHAAGGGVSMFGLAELLQTDAAINKGNSGGPMFNERGEIIGVVSSILSQSGGFEGLGFAVTSNTAKELIIDRRGFWGGINGLVLPEPLARALNVPEGYNGLLIQQVVINSPAAVAGLQVGTIPITLENQRIVLGGDIVLSIMGTPITASESMLALRDALSKVESGEEMSIEVLRGGKRITLTTTQNR